MCSPFPTISLPPFPPIPGPSLALIPPSTILTSSARTVNPYPIPPLAKTPTVCPIPSTSPIPSHSYSFLRDYFIHSCPIPLLARTPTVCPTSSTLLHPVPFLSLLRDYPQPVPPPSHSYPARTLSSFTISSPSLHFPPRTASTFPYLSFVPSLPCPPLAAHVPFQFTRALHHHHHQLRPRGSVPPMPR